MSRTTSALILATGFLILAVGSGARFCIGLTLVPMAKDFAMGRGMLGIIVGVYFFVTAVSMLLAGRLVDRLGTRFVLGAGIVISVLGIGLVAWADSAWHVLVLYGVVFGIGNGLASITPVTIMVTNTFPGRMGLASGIAISGMSVGQLVMVGGMALVMVSAGWRSVYVWCGIAHLALLPFLLAVPDDAKTVAQRSTAAASATGMTLAEAARTPTFWLLALAQGVCGLGDFFVSTHLVAFAQDKGLSTLIAGNLLALMGLTALFGVILAGWWCDRAGPLLPTLVCFLTRVASFILIMVDQSTLSVAVFTLVFGVTYMMTAPLTVLFIRESFGMRNVGTITGVVIMVHHMSGGLGAWLGGAVFDLHGSYDVAFAIMLASSILAATLTFVLGWGRWTSR